MRDRQMIAAVACCPHPPLLVPQISVAAAIETELLRSACDGAVSRMLAATPDRVVVVGSDGPAHGLRGYAPGAHGLPDEGRPPRPLALTIGAWLLERAGSAVPTGFVAVTRDGEPMALPAGWPAFDGERIGLLVMADGSARRSRKGPGYLDERAQPFDAGVVDALREADAATLADLDVALAEELLVGGVGPWRALGRLAGVDQRAGVDRVSWQAAVTYDDAPYGVEYVVATWVRD